MAEREKVAVIYATRGRRETVARALEVLAQQSLPADTVVICGTAEEDIPTDPVGHNVRRIVSAPGLTKQRNAGLQEVQHDHDYIVFFDDDFYPSRYWLERMVEIFRAEPEIACLTGRVLADGAQGDAIAWQAAQELVSAHDRTRPSNAGIIKNFSPYGCNMAFRSSAIGDLRFDERLVMYCWQEDRDFGASVRRRGGEIAKSHLLAGVHLGVKGGRVPGTQLGYSQVINPAYLWRKGNMDTPTMLMHVGKNMLANIAYAILGDPRVDRWGRLKGNGKGLYDLVVRRTLQPERAQSIS